MLAREKLIMSYWDLSDWPQTLRAKLDGKENGIRGSSSMDCKIFIMKYTKCNIKIRLMSFLLYELLVIGHPLIIPRTPIGSTWKKRSLLCSIVQTLTDLRNSNCKNTIRKCRSEGFGRSAKHDVIGWSIDALKGTCRAYYFWSGALYAGAARARHAVYVNPFINATTGKISVSYIVHHATPGIREGEIWFQFAREKLRYSACCTADQSFIIPI